MPQLHTTKTLTEATEPVDILTSHTKQTFTAFDHPRVDAEIAGSIGNITGCCIWAGRSKTYTLALEGRFAPRSTGETTPVRLAGHSPDNQWRTTNGGNRRPDQTTPYYSTACRKKRDSCML
jgi:hypothetical protein